ncbi:MAG: DUF58 domain-containing protein [Cyclobacteriaceae bacterium]
MKILKATYLTNRFFGIAIFIVVVFILSFLISPLLAVGQLLFGLALFFSITDLWMLFGNDAVSAHRLLPEKLSNGDENLVKIYLSNKYPFQAYFILIDELPEQFQKRDFGLRRRLKKGERSELHYSLKPVKRGRYKFGALNVFASTQIGFVKRRYQFNEDAELPVYPSFIQMKKFEFLAISNYLTEYGIKKIRRLGHNMEFEQIKDYVQGDDYRTVNWQATARKSQLMVNSFQDERSQQVYCVIDKGRVMQLPFEGMSLLDYSINAALALSNIALKKSDKAGLITYQHKIGTIVPASSRPRQMHLISEALYSQKTAWKESNYGMLFSFIRHKINQRSLMLLFTNFESIAAVKRQLPFLLKMAANHLLVCVIFKNTELSELASEKVETIEGIYVKTIAEKFEFEKKQIVKELKNYGIQSLLTTPQDLTVNSINKYLELKARGLV